MRALHGWKTVRRYNLRLVEVDLEQRAAIVDWRESATHLRLQASGFKEK